MKISDSTPFPVPLSENLWMLGNPHFNLYLVRGSRASVLIEVGVSSVVDVVIGQLKSLDTAPDYLVVTHPHSDHITGLFGLVNAFPDALTILGDGAVDFVLHPKALPAMIKEDAFIGGRLVDMGFQRGRPPIEGLELPVKRQEVKHPYEIDLGGDTLSLFPVMGHSPGGLAAWIPKNKALITSDGLGYHYGDLTFCPLFFTGLIDYMASLDRLAAMKPDIIGPGHNGPFIGKTAEHAIVRAREETEKLVERIRNSPKDPDQLAQDLFEEYYRGGYTLYTPENILGCMHLLVRRTLEADDFTE